MEAGGILANMSELPVLLESLLVSMEAFFLCALRASLGGVGGGGGLLESGWACLDWS